MYNWSGNTNTIFNYKLFKYEQIIIIGLLVDLNWTTNCDSFPSLWLYSTPKYSVVRKVFRCFQPYVDASLEWLQFAMDHVVVSCCRVWTMRRMNSPITDKYKSHGFSCTLSMVLEIEKQPECSNAPNINNTAKLTGNGLSLSQFRGVAFDFETYIMNENYNWTKSKGQM